MNISLPEKLKPSARADQDRQKLKNLLLDGAATAPIGIADEAYFDGLRVWALNRPAGDSQAQEQIAITECGDKYWTSYGPVLLFLA